MGDFRKLAVWERAYKLVLAVYRATGPYPSSERFGLTSQLRRAAVSVTSNIAEGTGRGGDLELRRFLKIARGSVNELECQLLLSRDLGYVDEDTWKRLNGQAQEVSRMIAGLITALKSNSTST
jgi:four helix bundle protein